MIIARFASFLQISNAFDQLNKFTVERNLSSNSIQKQIVKKMRTEKNFFSSKCILVVSQIIFVFREKKKSTTLHTIQMIQEISFNIHKLFLKSCDQLATSTTNVYALLSRLLTRSKIFVLSIYRKCSNIFECEFEYLFEYEYVLSNSDSNTNF